MTPNSYAILMAGGIGSRFWPVSTEDYPKQFHDMLDTGSSLLQATYERICHIIPKENILILTNIQYRELIKKQLPSVADSQILLEPDKRNTAPCILYAAMKINQYDPKATMLVIPCDHHIEQHQLFIDTIKDCLYYCNHHPVLLTLGITPTTNHTGYGYIKHKPLKQNYGQVLQFVEKPNANKAQQLLKQGDCLWNAGIFIWQVSSILKAFEIYQPKMYKLLDSVDYNTNREAAFIAEIYSNLENISIDYAIMEQYPEVVVRRANFDWNDLGTWDALYEQSSKDKNKNVIYGNNFIAIDSQQNILYDKSGDKTIVIYGLSDCIVAARGDTILICPKDKEQDIKHISTRVIAKKQSKS